MTIDATSSWNPTLSQLVKGALITVGAIDETEDPSADDYAVSVAKLQNWVKEQQASGLHLWTEEEAILFLQQGQYRYLLGGPTPDHACNAWSWSLLTTSTDALTTATAITVASVTGVSAGDNIGIALDTGATFWTTVVGAPDPVGLVVTLAAPLPSQASSGAYAFDYPPSATIGRPLRIPTPRGGRRYAYLGGIEAEIWGVSRQEWMALPNKTSMGQPNQWFYAPKLVSGELYVWNAAQDASYGFRFTWYRSIADWLVPGDTGDFPQEWASTLEWCLARELLISYSVPMQKAQMINAMAEAKLKMVGGWDSEPEPIQFGIDYEGMGYR